MPEDSRKPNRLKCYDYTTAGAYHVTICTKGKASLFMKNGCLTDFGIVAEKKIKETAEKYNVVINYYKVMGNHIHMLIENYYIKRSDKEMVNISDIVAYYKSNVSRECNLISGIKNEIWQRSFYDHILRGERDYYETIKYIMYNDLK